MAKKPKQAKSKAKWTKGRKLAQKRCARKSYLTIKPNAGTLLTLCCPPSKWHPRRKRKKCEGGLKKHLKRVPSKRKR